MENVNEKSEKSSISRKKQYEKIDIRKILKGNKVITNKKLQIINDKSLNLSNFEKMRKKLRVVCEEISENNKNSKLANKSIYESSFLSKNSDTHKNNYEKEHEISNNNMINNKKKFEKKEPVLKKEKTRIREFKIYPIKNFFIKQNQINPETQKIYQFHKIQSNYVIDEMIVLDDNLQTLRYIILNSEFNLLFSRYNIKYKVIINKDIEYLIGLLHTLSIYFLIDFKEQRQNFINSELLHEDYFKKRLISINNEDKVMKENIFLFKKTYDICKSSYESYVIIQKEVNCFTLSLSNFGLLAQFLNRTRKIVSELVFLLKILIQNDKDDENLLLKNSLNIDNTERRIRIKEDLSDKIKKELNFNIENKGKNNVYSYINNNERYKNIEKMLYRFDGNVHSRRGESSNNEMENKLRMKKGKQEIKSKEFKSVFLNSNVHKLINYINPKIKNEIISTYFTQKYLYNNEL